MVWSCSIALFRVIYIKANQWVKFVVGERRLLHLILLFGSLLQAFFTYLLFIKGDETNVSKWCSRMSAADFEILNDYYVSIFGLLWSTLD